MSMYAEVSRCVVHFQSKSAQFVDCNNLSNNFTFTLAFFVKITAVRLRAFSYLFCKDAGKKLEIVDRHDGAVGAELQWEIWGSSARVEKLKHFAHILQSISSAI